MTEKAVRFHQKCRAACWLIVITQLTVLFLRWPSLPDLIPAHYDAAGAVHRWGSKAELFLLPCFSILMTAALEWVSWHPKWWNIPAEVTENNREALQSVTLRILSIMELLTILGFALLEFLSMTGRPLPAGLTVGLVLVWMALIPIAILRLITFCFIKACER